MECVWIDMIDRMTLEGILGPFRGKIKEAFSLQVTERVLSACLQPGTGTTVLKPVFDSRGDFSSLIPDKGRNWDLEGLGKFLEGYILPMVVLGARAGKLTLASEAIPDPIPGLRHDLYFQLVAEIRRRNVSPTF